MRFSPGPQEGEAEFTETLGLEAPEDVRAAKAAGAQFGVSPGATPRLIEACIAEGKYVGICGQGPSDYPELAQWLMEQGIDSVSLNPDAVLETWFMLAGETLG